ncbi:hypothetical protein ACCC93_00555 [Herbaspirillum frisingense]
MHAIVIMPVTKAYVIQLFIGTLYTLALAGMLIAALVSMPVIISPAMGQQLGVLPWDQNAPSDTTPLYWTLGVVLVCALGLFYRALMRVVAPAKPALKPGYHAVTLLYLLAMAYGLAATVTTAFTPHYRDCGIYSQKLNGGWRQYRGQQLRVELCGAGPAEQTRQDRIRLRIYGERGELRALRHFTVQWGRDFPTLLEYSSDHLSYFDASDEDDFTRLVAMPPTLGDWIHSRLPLLD